MKIQLFQLSMIESGGFRLFLMSQRTILSAFRLVEWGIGIGCEMVLVE